jgi:hypothetical protein
MAIMAIQSSNPLDPPVLNVLTPSLVVGEWCTWYLDIGKAIETLHNGQFILYDADNKTEQWVVVFVFNCVAA